MTRSLAGRVCGSFDPARSGAGIVLLNRAAVLTSTGLRQTPAARRCGGNPAPHNRDSQPRISTIWQSE